MIWSKLGGLVLLAIVSFFLIGIANESKNTTGKIAGIVTLVTGIPGLVLLAYVLIRMTILAILMIG